MSDLSAAQGPAVRLTRLQRFPLRRTILIGLSVGLGATVTLGTIKTLTLPAGQRLSAATWRDLVVEGVAQGSIFALIAIGYTMVYGVLLMINFAHGEVFMAGAFSSFFVGSTLANSGFSAEHPILALLIMLVVAMSVSTLIAVLLERVAYRPLRGAPRLVPLITAIGASLFLQNTFRGFFGAQNLGYPSFEILDGSWMILGIPVQKVDLLTMVAAVIGMLALSYFVTRTRTGKAMRAVAEDKEIAALMGINVDRTVSITFAVGGMMAGLAGMLFALTFGTVSFIMGFIPGIKAFTAAVLGGIGSITGAALGGLILGLLDSVGPSLFLLGFEIPSPNQLRDVIAFGILVVVLIFRPGGLLGSDEPDKL